MSRRNAGSKFLSFVSVLRESKRKMKMLERSFGRREFFSFFWGGGGGGRGRDDERDVGGTYLDGIFFFICGKNDMLLLDLKKKKKILAFGLEWNLYLCLLISR